MDYIALKYALIDAEIESEFENDSKHLNILKKMCEQNNNWITGKELDLLRDIDRFLSENANKTTKE
jgi:hypothetical protein